MKLDWIISRLKTDGEGTKQEVLKALENATPKELQELAADIAATTIAMNVFKINKVKDIPSSEEEEEENESVS